MDDIVCAMTPEPFYAVGRWYEDFSQTTDEERSTSCWRNDGKVAAAFYAMIGGGIGGCGVGTGGGGPGGRGGCGVGGCGVGGCGVDGCGVGGCGNEAAGIG